MRKSITILSLLLFSIIVLSFLSPITMASTSSSLATKDSHVHELYPDQNEGTQTSLVVGELGRSEAYIGFDTSSPPSGWTTAEIEIDLYQVSIIQLTVSLVTAIWDELTITWNNKPVHDQEITKFTPTTNGIYTINVTNFISGSELSICINTTNAVVEHLHIVSREDTSTTHTVPIIKWTYPTPAPTIPGFIILILFGIMLGTCIYIIKKMKYKL